MVLVFAEIVDPRIRPRVLHDPPSRVAPPVAGPHHVELWPIEGDTVLCETVLSGTEPELGQPGRGAMLGLWIGVIWQRRLVGFVPPSSGWLSSPADYGVSCLPKAATTVCGLES